MKEKEIFDAVTNVRDELIEEAKVTRLKKKGHVWQTACNRKSSKIV